jgi:hypothetical protein
MLQSFLPALLLLAQISPSKDVTPTPKLPPANPVAYQDIDTAAVMVPIKAMFAGLAAHDGQLILAQTRPEGGAMVALERPDGSRTIRHLSWTDFAAGIKPGPDKYEERISDPAIEADGDIAMVWVPYTFYLNGKADHCGVDHFDLIRENGQWKVLNVTWSQRTTGCAAG